MIALPEPDRDAAPYTGYGRAHWESVADHLLLAVRPYANERHSLIQLPGPASNSGRWSDGLEGFARTFLLAAFRVAGDGGKDPHSLLSRYSEGLAAGVDPASPARWPRIDERRQARVEAASVAIALHETRAWLWDHLDERVQQQVIDWLAPMIGTSDYDNNWIWFQTIVEAFLRTVGGPWSAEDIERNLGWHDQWYVGDGWYTDGGPGPAGQHAHRSQNFDYYVGWALHFYPLWYSRILGEPPGHKYRERLSRYLSDARYLVGAGGGPLIQGRSLTYRFAMLAPFFAGALFNATPLRPGETRRLTSEVLHHFLTNGAVDSNGLLSIGWHGRFPRIRQLYTGPGSPYWASKAFAGLLLPADHPVWTQPEEALAVERDDAVHSLRGPGWIVSATKADGIVRVANHGSDHIPGRGGLIDDPFYLRHSYATHSAPELSAASLRNPADSHVALIDADGQLSHRGRIERVAQGDTWGVSRSRALWLDLSAAGGGAATWHALRTGPWLTTASVMRGPVEVRLVVVGENVPPVQEDPDGHWDSATGPWRLHLGGYAVAADAVDSAYGPGWARVTAPSGLTSEVYAIRGYDDSGVSGQEFANPLGVRSAVPWLRTSADVRPGDLLGAAVVLRRRGHEETSTDGQLPAIDVTVDAVTVVWADGARDTIPLGNGAAELTTREKGP